MPGNQALRLAAEGLRLAAHMPMKLVSDFPINANSLTELAWNRAGSPPFRSAGHVPTVPGRRLQVIRETIDWCP